MNNDVSNCTIAVAVYMGRAVRADDELELADRLSESVLTFNHKVQNAQLHKNINNYAHVVQGYQEIIRFVAIDRHRRAKYCRVAL